MIYMSLLFSIPFLGLISYTQNLFNRDNMFLFLSFFPLVFVGGMRSSYVGVDTYSYIKIFNVVSSQTINEILFNDFFQFKSIDKGYLLWNKFVSLISTNSQSIIIANTILFVLLFLLFFKKSSETIFLSVFLFLTGGLYFTFFNLMRQMIAIAFLCNSISYFKEKKYFKTALFYAIASSFHVISLIFIFVYVLYLLKLNKKRLTILISVLFIVFFNYMFFIEKIVRFLPKFSQYLNNKGVINGIGGMAVILIAELIIVFLSIYYYKWENEKDMYFKNILLLIYVFSVFVGTKFNYFDRIALLFRPSETLVIPEFTIKVMRKKVAIGYFLLILFMSIFYIWTFTNSDQLIYTFFWDN